MLKADKILQEVGIINEADKKGYYRLEEKMAKSILYSAVQNLKSISDAVQKDEDFDMKIFISTMKDLAGIKKKVIFTKSE